MTDDIFDESTFDAEVNRAWGEYFQALNRWLMTLTPDAPQHFNRPDDVPEGPHTRITFTATRANRVRATISDADLSHNPDTYDQQVGWFKVNGWRRLNNGSHIIAASIHKPDRVGMLATGALRSVWGVPHPSFLASITEPTQPDTTTDDAPDDGRRLPPRFFDDKTDLIKAFAAYVSSSTGVSVEPRSDGLLALPGYDGDPRSFARVCTRGSSIECFVRLTPMSDPADLAPLIAEFGDEWHGICFYLADGYLHAMRVIDCVAFHPENLRFGLNMWHHFLSMGAKPIMRRVGCDISEAGQTVPPHLRDIVHRVQSHGYTFKDVAEYCDFNTMLIEAHIRTSDRQIVDWTGLACDAALSKQMGEYKDLMTEAGGWMDTSELLRQALRYAVIAVKSGKSGQWGPMAG